VLQDLGQRSGGFTVTPGAARRGLVAGRWRGGRWRGGRCDEGRVGGGLQPGGDEHQTRLTVYLYEVIAQLEQLVLLHELLQRRVVEAASLGGEVQGQDACSHTRLPCPHHPAAVFLEMLRRNLRRYTKFLPRPRSCSLRVATCGGRNEQQSGEVVISGAVVMPWRDAARG